MEKAYYVVLSSGSYSDYDPNYFVGEREITQKELDKVGKKFGDELYDEFDSLPQKIDEGCKQDHEHYSFCFANKGKSLRYYPETGEWAYSGDLRDLWIKRMEVWLKAEGFHPLPNVIPELNVNYGDIPISHERRPFELGE